VDSLALSQLCIAGIDSTILDNIYTKYPNFQIGPYRLGITADEEYVNCRNYSVFEITHGDVTFLFLLAVVHVSVNCGSKSSINYAERNWENASIFAVIMYGIVCVTLDTPKFLYLHHHGATSGGWPPDSLCGICMKEYQPILRPFIGNCTGASSCRCNVCQRRAPSLRSLASYTVFHLTYNLSEFTLTHRTLYQQFLYAVESNIVRDGRLIPSTFSTLAMCICAGQWLRYP